MLVKQAYLVRAKSVKSARASLRQVGARDGPEGRLSSRRVGIFAVLHFLTHRSLKRRPAVSGVFLADGKGRWQISCRKYPKNIDLFTENRVNESEKIKSVMTVSNKLDFCGICSLFFKLRLLTLLYNFFLELISSYKQN